MLSLCYHVVALTIVTLNVAPILALFSSIGSEIHSAASSAATAASQVVGNLEGDLTDFEQAVQTKLSSALSSSDGVIAQFAMGHELAPPISTQLKSSHLDSNVTVGLYCDHCGYSQPAAFKFAQDKYSGYDDSWLGFALDSFDALFEVEVTLAANANGDLTMSLFKLVAAEDGVVVEVEFQLYLAATASTSLSFTAGLDLKLKEPAAIMMPALDPVVNLNESQRVGFNASSFSLTPIFNTSMPKLDFSVQFSLRTVFSVTVEEINIGALYLDLPAFNLTVDTVTNALSNCQTPPPGTPPDQVYRELIHTNGAFVAELTYELLGGAKNGTLETWTILTAWNHCFAFFPGLGSIGEVPSSPKSKALTAAPVTTCTTGSNTNATGTAAVHAALKSLSPGAKAGAVIGTLIGAALIAAISWFGGRAALSRSIQNGNTEANAALNFQRQRFNKFKSFNFFKRGNSGDPSPPAQNTPTWQSTPYQGEYYIASGPQAPNQPWQMAQKEPVVMTTEAVSPAPRHVSMGDDDGVSSLGSGEVTGAKFDGRWQPSVYGSPNSNIGHFSGNTEAHPMVPRKEIVRKSVPGHGRGSKSS